jgi:hypothetical protein
MTIILWTLGSLFALTLILCVVIPVVRWIRHMFGKKDVADEMFPDDEEAQAEFRDKVASLVLEANPGLTRESREFRVLYGQSMDRLLGEYWATGTVDLEERQ